MISSHSTASVTHKMSCQTAPAAKCDGEVQAAPPSFLVAVQVRRRPSKWVTTWVSSTTKLMVGPELPAAGFCFYDLLWSIRANPELSPGEVMVKLTQGQQVTYRQRQVLIGLLTAAIGTEQNAIWRDTYLDVCRSVRLWDPAVLRCYVRRWRNWRLLQIDSLQFRAGLLKFEHILSEYCDASRLLFFFRVRYDSAMVNNVHVE